MCFKSQILDFLDDIFFDSFCLLLQEFQKQLKNMDDMCMM